MTRGKLFVVSGPSGAGKGTICKEILDEEKNMKLSVSMTTSPDRVRKTKCIIILSAETALRSLLRRKASWNTRTFTAISTERRKPRL